MRTDTAVLCGDLNGKEIQKKGVKIRVADSVSRAVKT